MRLPVVGLVRCLLLAAALLVVLALATRGIQPAPDLVVVAVLAVALRSGPVTGAGVGLLAGWALDLVPPGSAHLGLTALLYAAAGALAGRCRRPGPVGLGWLGLVALSAAAATAAVRVLADLASFVPVDWPVVGLRVVLTSLMAVVVVPLVGAIETSLGRRGLA